ncbi:MAG: hypothetical protein AAF667_04655 [Pseudomonadota bacterium]
MAFFKGSYYETLRTFDPPEDARPPFKGVRARPIPALDPVLEHSVAIGDRLDSLAQHYYANPRDWRRLGDMNTEFLFPEDLIYDPETPIERDALVPQVGRVLLVPRKKEGR